MDYDVAFTQFYQNHRGLQTLSLPSRISTIASSFLDRPYQFEPLGEGPDGLYSILPLYRSDTFDCVTFVDTVLALTNATNFDQFKKNIQDIRYSRQRIDYTQRTDWFTDLEWNPNAQRLGYIQDVTRDIVDQNKKSIAQIAETIIDKPGWYAKKTLVDLDLPAELTAEQKQERLAQILAEGKKFKTQPSHFSYLPLSQLFDKQGQPNFTIWQQLPDTAVIELVRPNWRPVDPKDRNKDYGTNLNVSHVGLAVRKPEGIIFYHASFNAKKVVNQPLTDYLKAFLEENKPGMVPVAGIHVEKILG
jgi:hypothetical protein